jgi:serine/threonine protein kinase
MRNIASASYRFPADVDISPECLDFVSRVLVADPNERLTAEEMMQHPWLAGKMLPGTQTMGESLQSVGDIKEVMGEFSFILAKVPIIQGSLVQHSVSMPSIYIESNEGIILFALMLIDWLADFLCECRED